MTDFAAATDIEAILARVRAETAGSGAPAEPVVAGRRQKLSDIPLVPVPENGEAVPVGRASYAIEDFAALDDEDFLRNAYRVVLGRDIDGVGLSTRLPGLRSGEVSVVRVLHWLARSPEGRARGVKIRWLWPAAMLDRLTTLPVIGKMAEPFMRFLVRSPTQRRLSGLSLRQFQAIDDTNKALAAIRKNQLALDRRMAVAEQLSQSARHDAEKAADNSDKMLAEIRASRVEIAGQRAALSQLVAEARDKLPAEAAHSIEKIESAGLDSLYVAFENRFRGSQAEIARRAARYLPIFRACPPAGAGGTILDIGCGRGEFLSLLRGHDLAGRGVDLNSAMVDEARQRGHEVVEGDAIAYLEAQEEGDLAAITGFHIVEHLPFPVLVRLFDAALRALAPGGVVLFETPNPENLVVGACTFHYDPTHIRPLPPDFLRFVAEARGFSAARIIRSDADCQLSAPESGFTPQEVNDWFRQPPDYALYARKVLPEGAD